MKNKSSKDLIDSQDYRLRSIPTLTDINNLSDEQFSAYLRRGCRPEPNDVLWLHSLVEQIQELVSMHSRRIAVLEQKGSSTAVLKESDSRECPGHVRGLHVDPR
jgi:hypothetical protein